MQVSLICVYNNLEILETQLLRSIRENDIECEMILIDNSNKFFSSAAEALNHGANIATGDVLIFSHQDIYIKFPGEFESFVNDIYNKNVGDIIGAQGAIETQKENISNITAGPELDVRRVARINKMQAVSCIDEGFFGMRRETYYLYRFDEALCNNWHLYAVEMCLHARSMNEFVFVHPIQLHHYSWGYISKSYMKGLISLARVYRSRFKYIWTTCYKIETSRRYVHSLYWIWCVNRLIKGKLLD